MVTTLLILTTVVPFFLSIYEITCACVTCLCLQDQNQSPTLGDKPNHSTKISLIIQSCQKSRRAKISGWVW